MKKNIAKIDKNKVRTKEKLHNNSGIKKKQTKNWRQIQNLNIGFLSFQAGLLFMDILSSITADQNFCIISGADFISIDHYLFIRTKSWNAGIYPSFVHPYLNAFSSTHLDSPQVHIACAWKCFSKDWLNT